MPALDPQDPASFAAVEDVIARIRSRWEGQANVLAIVPAIKVSAGVARPSELVIGFHVTEKVAEAALRERGYRPIPAEIDGIATDVILARRPALHHIDTRSTRSAMFDTLVGGIAVGNADMNAYGTLGMTLLAQSDGRVVGLTNEHVLVFDGDGQLGDEVQQPRFYLNSQVSIDPAACCPNGQLRYRGVTNPIVDAAVAVFVVAALAAVLSDEIDPHRRGQDATVPAPDEVTRAEKVSVKLDYGDLPLPGTPYRIGVDWEYARTTDRRVMTHAVQERKRNEHVLTGQYLATDRDVYGRGDTVRFLAALGPEQIKKERVSCGRYFVTAAALSPSGQRAHKLILRPLSGDDARKLELPDRARRCWDFASEEPTVRFASSRMVHGLGLRPIDGDAEFVERRGGPTLLRMPDGGVEIRLPRPATEVAVRVRAAKGRAVKATGYGGRRKSGSDKGEVERQELTLTVRGRNVDRVVVESDGRAEIVDVCAEWSIEDACLYWGDLRLASDEELGHWRTYLFAQTRNDVPAGTDPVVAAQTIGGLPVTANFVDGGVTTNITYGQRCNIDIVPDGKFEVAPG